MEGKIRKIQINVGKCLVVGLLYFFWMTILANGGVKEEACRALCPPRAYGGGGESGLMGRSHYQGSTYTGWSSNPYYSYTPNPSPPPYYPPPYYPPPYSPPPVSRPNRAAGGTFDDPISLYFNVKPNAPVPKPEDVSDYGNGFKSHIHANINQKHKDFREKNTCTGVGYTRSCHPNSPPPPPPPPPPCYSLLCPLNRPSRSSSSSSSPSSSSSSSSGGGGWTVSIFGQKVWGR